MLEGHLQVRDFEKLERIISQVLLVPTNFANLIYKNMTASPLKRQSQKDMIKHKNNLTEHKKCVQKCHGDIWL